MSADGPLYGCIEAGGTKFVLGLARAPGEVMETRRIATSSPERTMAETLDFFRSNTNGHGSISAFGIASFGPIDLDLQSPQWGCILDTPKAGWSGTDLASTIADAFACPIGFDTDVNAAALAESLWGASIGADVSTYVTVGTGIGGGALVEGRPIHGLRHPEMGHMRPQRHRNDDEFPGICPFHGACLEGLASGPAIAARWGVPLSELAQDHEAHDIIAFYLGQLVIAQQALLSPRRIIFGGGVLDTPGLLDRIRRQAAGLANGYFGSQDSDYDGLVVAPKLKGTAGLLGALALAQRARR